MVLTFRFLILADSICEVSLPEMSLSRVTNLISEALNTAVAVTIIATRANAVPNIYARTFHVSRLAKRAAVVLTSMSIAVSADNYTSVVGNEVVDIINWVH
jgi:hypothetical protein